MSGLTNLERHILSAAEAFKGGLSSDTKVNGKPVIHEMTALARRGLLTVKVTKHGSYFTPTRAGRKAQR